MISTPIFLGCIILLSLRGSTAFAPKQHVLRQQGTIQETPQQHQRYLASCWRFQRGWASRWSKKDDDDVDDSTSLEEFLDQPFFDPDAYDDSDKSLLGRLAAFVRQDYELAETIYVGILFVVLVIFSQELLRMKLYGDHYIPFSSGSTSGRLF